MSLSLKQLRCFAAAAEVGQISRPRLTGDLAISNHHRDQGVTRFVARAKRAAKPKSTI
jgi:hypothetical protein